MNDRAAPSASSPAARATRKAACRAVYAALTAQAAGGRRITRRDDPLAWEAYRWLRVIR